VSDALQSSYFSLSRIALTIAEGDALDKLREAVARDEPIFTELRGDDAHSVGRNDPCPCGSGRKYKNCHGR
jgi:preprotein translocase subunit SecA